MATPEEAVAHARDKFSIAESGIQKAIDKLNAMPKDFKDVQAGGPLDVAEGVKQFGYLESLAFSAEAQYLAGEAADLMIRVVIFHQRCTDRATELGIDGSLAMSGGGR